ncbi:flagellar hook-associated protein FlgK [Devosia sp. 2618]|uniref:flagellar hook-associated protein FlgK n=1 Tax=Devosia sp. 2618 TaxID=3156454 RepID=UPI00339772BA
MGLISSMNNAVAGLRINQDSIDVLSRNVANAGTPGYHRQSINVVDYNSQNSSYARTESVNRAFNASLQTYYNRQVSDTAKSGAKADYLNQLQTYLGKPGSAGSLDTLFGSLKNSLQSLATSPDDYTTRAAVIAQADAMAQRLNQLSNVTQGLRQETEAQIANGVNNLNGMLSSLQEVNSRMLDLGMSDTARASLQDQRDRLVSGIAEMVDVNATYRPDGTVSLMTRSGVGLLDVGVSTFKFTTAGALGPASQASSDSALNKVGTLTLTTPSGLIIDLSQRGVLQGGEIAGLLELRDKTLVEFQNQLDDIAAGLAAIFSSDTRQGQAAGAPSTAGLKVDLTGIQAGNEVLLSYKNGGVDQRVRLVNSANGEDYTDASGQKVIAVDFNDPASVAALSTKLPGLTFGYAGGELTVLGGGAVDVTGLTGKVTATGAQPGSAGLNLFVDQSNSAFTNNVDTDPSQKVGFASRIKINPAIVADNSLLVQASVGGTLGDAARANYFLEQLNSMSFVSGGQASANKDFPLNGTLGDIIGQVLNYQGSSINTALSQSSDRQLTLDTIVTQMKSEYGVNVNEEMARLLELQNAYAANARVVSIVKELLDTLFRAT